MAEKSSRDQANISLVWRNRKKNSQISKVYFYLPFFLLIILCFYGWDYFLRGPIVLMEEEEFRVFVKHKKFENIAEPKVLLLNIKIVCD
jgi:hypothetical protein